MADEELNQALELIKSGDKEAGKNLLTDLVKRDPDNEKAWLWLASMTDGEQRISCLQKALAINPKNEEARAYLEKLKPQPKAQHERPIRPSVVHVQAEPTSQFSSTYQKYLQPDGTYLFKPSWKRIFLIKILPVGTIVLIILMVLMFSTGPVPLDLFLVVIAILFSIEGVIFLYHISPIYHVRLTKSEIIGPMNNMIALLRHGIRIEDIAVERTIKDFGWQGHDLVFSDKNQGIYLSAFDRQTFYDLLSLIVHLQSD